MVEPISGLIVSGITSAASDLNEKIADEVVSKSADGFFNLLSSIVPKIRDDLYSTLKVGFQSYLRTSYERCRYYRTILEPHRPIPVMDNYVSVDMQCGGTIISDEDLINKIFLHKRVVITGLAGSGKSTFMKYFTLSVFHNYPIFTPIFLELRNFNSSGGGDLLSYVKNFCAPKGSSITTRQFEQTIKNGNIVLILDGYDELDQAIRKSISSQILSFSVDYPDLTIVCSSRNESGLDSIGDFYVYKIQEFSKKKCLKLIDTLNYDAGVKKRFYEKVEFSLYDSHKSFLSYPLLIIIMLFTFEISPTIPRKMNEFYDRAFDALFMTHDSYKDQYERKRFTDLTQIEFRECFAAFCGFSYIREVFSFSELKLMEYGKAAIKYYHSINPNIKILVNPEDFIKDLKQSICMLQRDGLDWNFVHRSFQEYFAATFALKMNSEKFIAYVAMSNRHYRDSMLTMAYEINAYKVENDWVVPNINRIINYIDKVPVYEFMASIFSKVRFSSNGEGHYNRSLIWGHMFETYMYIHVIYGITDFSDFFDQNLISNKSDKFGSYSTLISEYRKRNSGFISIDDDLSIYEYEIEINKKNMWIFSENELNFALSALRISLVNLRDKISTGKNDADILIGEFF